MWLHSDEADSVQADPAEYEHLREELADVFWYPSCGSGEPSEDVGCKGGGCNGG
jgi:NTP pyrophosphatase (non-canonical NTP hydrolase)